MRSARTSRRRARRASTCSSTRPALRRLRRARRRRDRRFSIAQILSIDPLAGTGLELDAIAAVVIGGASLYGGRGSIIGTLIGVFIMVMIRNGLNLLGVSPFWQGSAIGAIIILALLAERLINWRSAR